MPQVCSLCRHPQKAEVNAALVAGSDPLRHIAARFGTSTGSLRRHREHIPRALCRAAEAAAETEADDLLERTRTLETAARRLLRKAEEDGDLRAAIAAVKAALDVVELLHRVAAEQKSEAGALVSSSEWRALRERIYDALERFPEALEAVRMACREVEAGDYRETVVVSLKLPDGPERRVFPASAGE